MLAFPISDFNQELASNEEIASFVRENFPEVDFPLFSLSSLHNNLIYQNLHKQKPDKEIKWNFYKYLVDWNGQVRSFYDKKVSPLQLSGEIEQLLEEASQSGGGWQKLVTS